MMSTENSYLGQDYEPATPPSNEEKNLGLLAHIITLLSTFIGPLIIYFLKKDESAFITHHAKESLNFQITMTLVCILLAITIVGLVLIWLVGILTLILVIIATIKASEGKLYRYPFTIRLIK